MAKITEDFPPVHCFLLGIRLDHVASDVTQPQGPPQAAVTCRSLGASPRRW